MEILASGQIPDNFILSDFADSNIPPDSNNSKIDPDSSSKIWIEGEFSNHLDLALKKLPETDSFIKLLNENRNSANVIRYSTNRVINGRLKHTGGFADRMKGIVTAALLSAEIGYKFEIEWEHPVEITEKFSPRGVDWRKSDTPGNNIVDIIGSDVMLIPTQMKSDELIDSLGIKKGVNIIHANSIFTNLLSSPLLNRTLKKGSINKSGTVKSTNRLIPYQIILSLFQYRPRDYEANLATLFRILQIENRRTIAVHFRTGGDGNWNDFAMDDMGNLVKLMDYSLHSSGISSFSDGMIFFCSDSDLAKINVRKEYPNLNIVTIGLDIGHTDPKRTQNLEDAASGFHSAVLESHLISLCDEIYCGKGGFALLSAVRSGLVANRYYD